MVVVERTTLIHESNIMRLPVIQGIIDRRVLANFRIDPEVMAAALPRPFRPLLFNGFAIGGICLIRLKKIRPRFMPLPWGIASENAAHRIAVEWDDRGETKQGVYIPRRDTSSRLNAMAGGTIFPGEHHLAKFDVAEHGDHYSVKMLSHDGLANVAVVGSLAKEMPQSSVFGSTDEASRFFEQGSLGYSKTKSPGRYDGLELRCKNWKVSPLAVDHVESSYFDDETLFPGGSVQFDSALLMTDIDHQWHGHGDLCCESQAVHS